MKLLVLGATGPTGRAVIADALKRGHMVTAMARNPGAANLPPDVAVMAGDMLNAATLDAVVKGHDAVLSTIGTKLSRKPTTQLSDGARNLVAAMERSGVKRLICITGLGAGDSRGHGAFLYDHVILPLLLDEIYKDKTRQEEVIAASGLDWTIVRPAELKNRPASGNIRAATNLAGYRGSSIARADVAAFMLDQLTAPASIRQRITISN